MATYKSYHTGTGVMGWIPWLKKYMLFADESDYKEYLEGHES